jgi:CRISPR system Cascade subunit CasB
VKLEINRNSTVGKVILDWWSKLDHSGQGRADRAMLRRAHDIISVECSPAFQRIYQRIYSVLKGGESEGDLTLWQQQGIAAAIGLLAHVKKDDDKTLDSQEQGKLPLRVRDSDDPEGRNAISEIRFMRLLESPDRDALFTGLRRMLPLVNNQADVVALARDVVYWNDDVKRQWSYHYPWPTKRDE